MADADLRARLQAAATCSICAHLYSDPVTLDCGHNFCLSCFDTFKRKEDLDKACPECQQEFDPEKEMKPNTGLANMVELVKELQIAPGGLCEEHGERLQLFCEADGELLCVLCMGSGAHRKHPVIPMKEAEREFKDVRSTQNRCEKVNFQYPEQEMTKRKEKETNIEIVKTQKPEEEMKKYDSVILFTVDNQGVIRAGRPPAAYDDDFTSRARVLGKLSDVSHVLFSPEGLLYVVKGSEIYRGPMPSDPSKNWLQDTAKRVGKTDWGRFERLFFHPKGALYATTHEGELYTGPPPANEDQSWLYTKATKVGNNGWDWFHALFFDPQGVLHAVTEDTFFKRSPPMSAEDNWIGGSQAISRGSVWSGRSHFMSFTPDGNLWYVSKSDGKIYTASPPTRVDDNWLGRAQNLGHSYFFKFMAFTREVENNKEPDAAKPCGTATQ